MKPSYVHKRNPYIFTLIQTPECFRLTVYCTESLVIAIALLPLPRPLVPAFINKSHRP